MFFVLGGVKEEGKVEIKTKQPPATKKIVPVTVKIVPVTVQIVGRKSRVGKKRIKCNFTIIAVFNLVFRVLFTEFSFESNRVSFLFALLCFVIG